MTGLLRFHRQPVLERPAVIVSWTVDAAGLSEGVTTYLNRKLGNEVFCEIDPDQFFPLEGVTVQDDVVQFPEARFYAGARKDLVVLQSTPPRFDWYRFLNLVLDVVLEHCGARELYTIGGMVSIAPHTGPREIVANFTSAAMKEALASYNLNTTLNYETPPGQRPTLNSFLLWAARRRNLPAAAIWVPMPFYMAGGGDLKAQLRVLEFFNRLLHLHLDFDDLDEDIRQQNRLIDDVRQHFPGIDESIRKLERGEAISSEESEQLVEEIQKSLRRKRP